MAIGAVALASAIGTSAAAQAPNAAQGVAVPAASIDGVAIGGSFLAVLKTSAMGDRSLLVFREPSGQEILRRDGVTGDLLQLRHGRVLLNVDGRPIVIDLETNRTWPAIPDGPAGLTSCLAEAAVFTVVKEDSAALSLVDRPLGASDTPSEPSRIGSVPADARLLCASSRALVMSRAQQHALLWSGAEWTTIPMESRDALALVDAGLYAVVSSDSRTTIAFYAFDTATWQECGEIRGAPLRGTIGPGADGRSIVVAIATATGAREVVEVSPNQIRPVATRSGTSPFWASDGRVVAEVERRDARPWIAVAPLFDIAPQPAEHGPGALRFDLASDVDRTALALAWLESQLGRPVETVLGIPGRLIDSYADDRSAGWTYDAALAAIAFTAAHRPQVARDLLAGLSSIQRDDGSWDFAYDPDAVRPIEGPRYIGSMAWVIMAVNGYEAATGDRTFSPMAERGLQFIDRFIVRDAASLLDGGVSMGPAAPGTFSAEHNADAYAAFRSRSQLTGRTDYAATAAGLRAFILRALWTGDGPDMSYFRVGQKDDSLYLDPQTWTALALVGGDDDALLRRALDTAERRLKTTNGQAGSVRTISGFRDTESADPSKVWSEGSEGMVAARLALGQTEAAKAQHTETQRLQTTTGGVIYATDNRDGWSTRPSVAGTAWFVLDTLTPPRNPFAPQQTAPAAGEVPR